MGFQGKYYKNMKITKQFIVYCIIGISLTLFSVFSLWLMIDILNINTVISGFLIAGICFFLRFAIYKVTKLIL